MILRGEGVPAVEADCDPSSALTADKKRRMKHNDTITTGMVFILSVPP
jgi:hypothetical protein